MKSVAADTHAVLWFLENDRRLTSTAAEALDGAERILLPSVCLLAALDLGVVLALQDIPRTEVPDLPDRVIAATAWHHCVPLVTRDGRIRSCGVDTIW